MLNSDIRVCRLLYHKYKAVWSHPAAFYIVGGKMKSNYTYIVKCKDGSLYTGWTNDLDKRIQAHNQGKGAKYTRSRCPVELVYYETFRTKEEAMRREYAIKRLTTRQKHDLIKS